MGHDDESGCGLSLSGTRAVRPACPRPLAPGQPLLRKVPGFGSAAAGINGSRDAVTGSASPPSSGGQLPRLKPGFRVPRGALLVHASSAAWLENTTWDPYPSPQIRSHPTQTCLGQTFRPCGGALLPRGAVDGEGHSTLSPGLQKTISGGCVEFHTRRIFRCKSPDRSANRPRPEDC